MATYNNFKAVFNKINRAYTSAKVTAANRAMSNGRTQLTKIIRTETGLKSDVVKKRMRILKATAKNQRVTLSVGIKVPFPATLFKPKQVKVQTTLGARYGASYQLGKKPRIIAEGAFLTKAKNGKQIMIKRKGAAKYPTTTIQVRPIEEITNREITTITNVIQTQYAKIFSERLQSNVNRLK